MLDREISSSNWLTGSKSSAVQLRHALAFPGSDARGEVISIETPRLILNDLRENEFPEFYSLFKALDEAGQSWLLATVRKPETVRDFFDEILENQRVAPRHTYRLAVRLKGEAKIIGYVSLCDLNSTNTGKPDTGVLIDPRFQRGGFAREARVAINYFAVQAGARELFCDVRTDNTPSINNVLKMGYEQLFQNGTPITVENQGVMGVESCYRYRIRRHEILEVLPPLLQELAQRYWGHCTTELTPEMIDEMIEISYRLEPRRHPQRGRGLRWWQTSRGWLAK